MKKVGLENSSNNCYLNSIVQIFFQIPEFIDYFNNVYKENENENEKNKLQINVLKSFVELFKKIGSCHLNYTSPQLFKNAMGMIDQMFNMDEECDAQEFYLCFINALQEGLNIQNLNKNINNDNNNEFLKFKNYILNTKSTVVDKVFLGALAHNLTCLYCNNVSCSYDIFYNIALPLPNEKKTIKFVLFPRNINEYPKCEKFDINIYIETSIHLLDSISLILKNSKHKLCYSYGLYTLGLGCIRFAQSSEYLCNVLDYGNNIIVGTEFPPNDKLNCFIVNQFINYHNFDKLVTIDQLKKEPNFKKKFKTNIFKNISKYFSMNSINPFIITLGSHYVGLPFLLTIPKNYSKNNFYIWIYDYSIKHIKNTLRVAKTLNISLYPFENIENYSFKIIAIIKDQRHIIIDQKFEPYLIEHMIGFGIVWNYISNNKNFKQSLCSNYEKVKNYNDHPVIQIGKLYLNNESSSIDSLYSSISESTKLYKNFQNNSRSSVDILNDMQIFRPRKFDCCLQKCIEIFFNDKIIIYERMCSKCNKICNSNSIEKLAIPPNILTIHLKRFNYQDGGKKTDVYVDIPKIININSEYIINTNQSINYRLIAIVCHIGTFSFGHYFSLVDEIGILNVNSQLQKWILFDDINVEYISLEKFHRMQTWAYLLFYKRIK